MRASAAVFLSIALLMGGCGRFQSFPSTLNSVQSAAAQQRQLTIEQWRTEQGSKVLFVRSASLPMADLRLVFDAGSARDSQLPGLASLTSALIGEGASDLSVDDIARGFEDLGVAFASSSYRDMAIAEMRVLTDAEYFAPALDLFIQVVSSPSFPQTALQRIQRQTLTALQQQQQVPGPQVSNAFYRTLFADHPYGHPSGGTLESVPQLTRQLVGDFYQRYYNASNAVIAIVGDLTRQQAQNMAARISNALPAGQAAESLPRARVLTDRQMQHLMFDSSQTTLLLGNQSIWRGHPDWVPLYVGNHILGGGGFGSILTEEVREQRGFVYGIGSSFSPMAAAGPFTVQFQTANKNADEALALTLKLINEFVAAGPTEQQVADALANITGSFPLTTAENDSIVGQLGAIGFYQLREDYLQWFESEVRKVTAASIRAAFQRNLNPDNLAIVSIGPQVPALEGEGFEGVVVEGVASGVAGE